MCCVWLLLLVMAVGEEVLKQALWGRPGAVLEQFPLSEEVGFWVVGDGALRKAASFPGKVYSPTYFHLSLHIFPKWCRLMVIGEDCPLNVSSCPYSFPSCGVGAGEFSGFGCSMFASPVISLCCWVAKWCPALCDPVDSQPARFFCPWDFQAGILEQAAISFPRRLPDPGIKSSSPTLAGGLYHWASHPFNALYFRWRFE